MFTSPISGFNVVTDSAIPDFARGQAAYCQLMHSVVTLEDPNLALD